MILSSEAEATLTTSFDLLADPLDTAAAGLPGLLAIRLHPPS
jgi:hypothetical protein